MRGFWGRLRLLGVGAVAAASVLCAPAGAVVPGANDRYAWATVVFSESQGADPAGRSQIYADPCNADVSQCFSYFLTSGTTRDDEPAWSPVETKIAFQRDPICDDAFCAEIWVMDWDGTNQQPLTSNDGGTTASVAPSWSPDGQQIVFWTNRTGTEQIWAMDADGTNEHPLTTGPCDFKPDWSPGGDRIVFQSCRDGDDDIYVMNVDGSGQTRLTDNAVPDTSPAWSADGQKIAFASNPGGNRDIYTMKPDGTAVTRITTDPGPDDAPAFTPDNSQILFTSVRAGTGSDTEIWSIRPDGTNQNLFGGNNYTDDTAPDWGPILPRGYARPKGATPFHAALVPAYSACTTADRLHGPPLASPSCNEPEQTSPNLTVGTADSNGQPAKYIGSLRYDTIVGNPSTSANEADVHIEVLQSDVRWASDLTDYTGQLWTQITWRITDGFTNSLDGASPSQATLIDIPITTAIINCAATADPAVGASCDQSTSFNAIVPGAIKERRRMVIELGQVEMYDGGPDGQAGTSPDSVFARQGLFIP
jgi:dipeptidyl aminopeptidase/acylaminoacyl peptidase